MNRSVVNLDTYRGITKLPHYGYECFEMSVDEHDLYSIETVQDAVAVLMGSWERVGNFHKTIDAYKWLRGTIDETEQWNVEWN